MVMERRLKLLITDESDEFKRNYAKEFENAGLELYFVAKDGFVALKKIEEINPDIVLLDLFMPGLDGIGVIKSIKREKKEIQFIVMSAFSSPILEREVILSGASYFVITPFQAKELADCMKQICGMEAAPMVPLKGETDTKVSLEIQVTEILHQIGVPAHIKGYHYLRDSIIMAIENPDIINAVTKQLYPSVAKKYDTTSSRVERAIRHAIEVAWDRGDVDVLNSYFGYTIHNTRGKPTNSEFIAMISDRLRLEMKNAS